MTVTTLTSRRRVAPQGMAGGAPGALGREAVVRANGAREALEPRGRAELAPGDAVEMETPGGGGWGAP